MKESAGFRLTHAIGVVTLVVVVFFPFYWLLTSSLKTQGELFGIIRLIPRSLTFEHYHRILFQTRFPLYAVNTLFVSSVSTAIILGLSILTGYSLSSYRFPFRRAVERSILYTRMFPGVLLIIPVYVFMARIRLLDTLWSLVAIYVTIYSPFAILLLRNFFDQIPKEISESAYVDGASRVSTLYYIVLPLLRPGLVTVATWAFILTWSEYIFGMILIHDQNKRTLVVGLAAWMGEYHIDWGALTAGSVLVVLPALLFFGVLGRGFVKGLTAGSMTG
jgi:multiple sugar transport system permease protein